MRRGRHSAVLLLFAVGLLRLAGTDAHLHVVRAAMRGPLVLSGVCLLAAGLAGVASGEGLGPMPVVSWALVLPAAAVLLVAPPALGAFTASRSAATVLQPASRISPLSADGVVELPLSDFAARAVWDAGRTLVGQRVRLTGFATRAAPGAWYLTRLTVTCCAADVLVTKILVEGGGLPPAVGTWVQLTAGGRPAVVSARRRPSRGFAPRRSSPSRCRPPRTSDDGGLDASC